MEPDRKQATTEANQQPSYLGGQEREGEEIIHEDAEELEDENVASAAEVIAIGLIGTSVFINFGATISLGRTFLLPVYGQIPLKNWLYFLIWTGFIFPFAYCGGKNGRYKKPLLITAGTLLLIDSLLILYNVIFF